MWLTIAIPTFNRPDALKLTIKEIFRQSESTESVFELLICDNGFLRLDTSSYASPKIVFRHVMSEKNIGFAGNVIRALTLSAGKYTWLMSDDDILLPNALIDLEFQIRSTDFHVLEISALDKKFQMTFGTSGIGVTPCSPEEFFTKEWRALIFVSSVIFQTDAARHAIRRLLRLELQNQTYPQILILFAIAESYPNIGIVGGAKIQDTQPDKHYRPMGAFNVRIRDTSLLPTQIRSLNLNEIPLADVDRFAFSSFFYYSLRHFFEFPSRQASASFLKSTARLVVKGFQRVDVRTVFFFGFIGPAQFLSCWSPWLGKKTIQAGLIMIRKRDILESLLLEFNPNQDRANALKSEYPDYDPS
jgi:glycosyltransferase involved in cell wall biosynthesis